MRRADPIAVASTLYLPEAARAAADAEFVAAAACARVAKLPAGTCPPAALAVALWMRDAAECVITVRAAFDPPLELQPPRLPEFSLLICTP